MPHTRIAALVSRPGQSRAVSMRVKCPEQCPRTARQGAAGHPASRRRQALLSRSIHTLIERALWSVNPSAIGGALHFRGAGAGSATRNPARLILGIDGITGYRSATPTLCWHGQCDPPGMPSAVVRCAHASTLISTLMESHHAIHRGSRRVNRVRLARMTRVFRPSGMRYHHNIWQS